MSQRINEQIGILAPIEPKGHFVAVGLEMLRADSMPRSHDAALQERERGFNRVRVDVPVDVNLELVPDGLVASSLAQMFRRAAIGLVIVGEQHVHIFAQILADEPFERPAFHVFRVEEPKIAAALPDADDNFLLVLPATAFPDSLSADIRFVHFNFAVQHGFLCFDHCGPDAMAEIPRGLVADSERPLNLASRHPFLRFTQQQRRHEPFRQRQVGVIEDRASRHGELIVAILAVEQFLAGFHVKSANERIGGAADKHHSAAGNDWTAQTDRARRNLLRVRGAKILHRA